MGGCNRDRGGERGWDGRREAPCWCDRVTGGGGWRESVCLFVSASKCEPGLGDGGSPVLLMSWQVGPPAPSSNDPTPKPPTTISQSPRSTQQASFIPSYGSIWSAQPPNGPVCGRMCGSLKSPICCPWLGARGAGNSRLWCRKSRELLRLFFLVDVNAQG